MKHGPVIPGFHLTDEGPARVFGFPLLCTDEQAWAAADTVRGIRQRFLRAGEHVALWASRMARTDAEYAAAATYLRLWPEGPQLGRVVSRGDTRKEFLTGTAIVPILWVEGHGFVNLRVVLRRLRLTQSEVARALGVSRISINAWCAGRSDPSWAAGVRLLEYLRKYEPGLTVEELTPAPPEEPTP